jgi:hypothetical protein
MSMACEYGIHSVCTREYGIHPVCTRECTCTAHRPVPITCVDCSRVESIKHHVVHAVVRDG